ncbi:kinase-like protein, partial [Bimuria novae-zelandiae CBS 107.79]
MFRHRHFLGLLLYPVATCDLATFLEDIEEANDIDSGHDALLYQIMGCIISAVAYLHGCKIRHKDLKPSNILLSSRNVWLTDFGTATDFSNQTVSTTENLERGTPKYHAPEMAAYQPNGRPADIFSLGCVLLEIHTLLCRKP